MYMSNKLVSVCKHACTYSICMYMYVYVDGCVCIRILFQRISWSQIPNLAQHCISNELFRPLSLYVYINLYLHLCTHIVYVGWTKPKLALKGTPVLPHHSWKASCLPPLWRTLLAGSRCRARCPWRDLSVWRRPQHPEGPDTLPFLFILYRYIDRNIYAFIRLFVAYTYINHTPQQQGPEEAALSEQPPCELRFSTIASLGYLLHHDSLSFWMLGLQAACMVFRLGPPR